MGVYAELRGFVLAHRTCGVPSGTREADTETGFRLRISCPCGARFDRWLAAAPVEDKVEFLEGLAWLDGFSIRKHQKPFRNCSPAEQTAMLEALDAGDDPLNSAGERFFRRAKSVTAAIYYSTEIGFRELNKGNRVPSTFACRAE